MAAKSEKGQDVGSETETRGYGGGCNSGLREKANRKLARPLLRTPNQRNPAIICKEDRSTTACR